jgi:2Fe-2S ferredoxin
MSGQTVKITYVEANGEQQVVEARIGQTIMAAAVKNGVKGIAADCGGAAACGTCRIYIDDAAWRAKFGPVSDMERAMIDYAGDKEPHVRLSCQIVVTEQHDGLIVRMPESQH